MSKRNTQLRRHAISNLVSELGEAAKKTKKAAPVKAQKKAPFTVITQNEEGYTAEELWIVELARKDHDCRLPRGVV